MAQTDNPLDPIHQKVLRIETRLMDLLRNVLAKMKPWVQGLVKFLSEVSKSAKDLAKSIGKSAVQSILKAGATLVTTVSFVEKQTFEGIKMARKIVGVIRKAVDPQKVFKAVKALVARLAKTFRVILVKVSEVMNLLNPLDVVLTVVNTMKMVLQMIFKWISQSGPISSGVKKAKTLVKKSLKLLRQEAKQVTEMVKEVNKLKPA
ncbi:MAG: hypothetical protein AAF214_04425 [Pseudomonadota bacterium]